MQIVYADLLFLVNFSMDFLCFYITSSLLHRKLNLIKYIFASALGGIYSIFALFIKLNNILMVVIDIATMTIMCAICYIDKDTKIKQFTISCLVYLCTSFALGGSMTALFNILNKLDLPFYEIKNNPDKVSVWIFAVVAFISGLIALFSGKLYKNSSLKSSYMIDIKLNEKNLSAKGIIDSCNLLKEPISNKSVILIDSNIMKRLLPDEIVNYACKGDIFNIIKISDKYKARLIPLNTVKDSGFICAFIPDTITIYSEDKKIAKNNLDVLIAPSKLNLEKDNYMLGCNALIPLGII